MIDFAKGAIFGMAIGLALGAVIVAKNKKLATKIQDGVDAASEKFESAKDKIEQKLEECGESSGCGCEGEAGEKIKNPKTAKKN